MNNIRRLPVHLINRIAAGEVIERPASVVKELVENALDAGATHIDILAGNGGRTLRVADNGHGMTRDNARLAFENHATSKLSADDDLTRILTLGFRGEALASVSAVSRLTCDTRPMDQPHGTRIVIEGGSEPVVTDCGCAPGTALTIEDLFFNTPARLKFLKRPATELAAIEETVHLLALSHPHVRLVLTLNGKQVFQTRGDGDLRAVLAAVIKAPELTPNEVLPVFFEDPVTGANVSALLATPAATNFHYKSRRGWWQLLNRRGIRCQLMSKAVEAAFVGLIPDGVYPLCLVHLTLAPEVVDINVHPAKREVRYQHPGEVFALVRHGLRQAMETQFSQAMGITANQRGIASATLYPAHPAKETPFTFNAAIESAHADSSQPWRANPDTPSNISRLQTHPRQVQQALRLYEPLSQASPLVDAADRSLGHEQSTTPLTHASSPSWRVIGQLFNTYILLETAKGLMVVDQHIASERAGYERLTRQLSGEAACVQPLAVPVEIPLSPAQLAVLQERQEALARLGFDVSREEDRTPLLTSYPLIYPGRTQLSPVEQIAHLLHQWETAETAEPDWEQLTSTLACHSAVRAGDRLSEGQMTQVVQDWLACQLPWSCPHGRPIAHTIEASELNQFFDRSSLPVNTGLS